MESHNLECLIKLLTRSKNKRSGISGVTRKQVSDWHDSDFRQNTMGYDAALCLNSEPGCCIPGVMSGGGIEMEKFTVDGKMYQFKVNYSEAKLIKVVYDDGIVDEEPVEARVYFLSQRDGEEHISFACIYLIVYASANYGLIQGLTNKYLCSGYSIGEKVELISGKGQGYILMQALIQYCYKYRDILGIDRLELNDESKYECRPRIIINLSHSNILCGKYPYYMQFGFRPMALSAMEKIQYNLSIMSGKRVTIELLDKLDIIAKGDVPDSIINLVKDHLGGELTLCINMILYKDCNFYAKCYKKLFDSYGLLELDGDETAFELFL